MTDMTSLRRHAVRRFSIAVLLRFLIVTVGLGGLTYAARSALTVYVVAAGFDRSHLGIIFIGVNVVLSMFWYIGAFAILYWLISDQIDRYFVPRAEASGSFGERSHV